MPNLLKDPLVHFLALGLGLFVLFDFVASDEAAYDSQVIEVDREALLTYVQYRMRAFEPGAAAAHLEGLSDEDFERLIDDYVREEALHREATALGVGENDYVIKSRMIQSVEFITGDFVEAAVQVSDEDVAAYYAANRHGYAIAPFVTFTHVFFSAERRDLDELPRLAEAKLRALNAERVPFSEAPRHGDRFPYLVNYVERDRAFVASHFGPPMAEQIFALAPDAARWHGPFASEYGYHLVMVTRKQEGLVPELAEIEARVRLDAEREAIAERKKKAIQSIVDTYEVRRSFAGKRAGVGR